MRKTITITWEQQSEMSETQLVKLINYLLEEDSILRDLVGVPQINTLEDLGEEDLETVLEELELRWGTLTENIDAGYVMVSEVNIR